MRNNNSPSPIIIVIQNSIKTTTTPIKVFQYLTSVNTKHYNRKSTQSFIYKHPDSCIYTQLYILQRLIEAEC